MGIFSRKYKQSDDPNELYKISVWQRLLDRKGAEAMDRGNLAFAGADKLAAKELDQRMAATQAMNALARSDKQDGAYRAWDVMNPQERDAFLPDKTWDWESTRNEGTNMGRTRAAHDRFVAKEMGDFDPNAIRTAAASMQEIQQGVPEQATATNLKQQIAAALNAEKTTGQDRYLIGKLPDWMKNQDEAMRASTAGHRFAASRDETLNENGGGPLSARSLMLSLNANNVGNQLTVDNARPIGQNFVQQLGLEKQNMERQAGDNANALWQQTNLNPINQRTDLLRANTGETLAKAEWESRDPMATAFKDKAATDEFKSRIDKSLMGDRANRIPQLIQTQAGMDMQALLDATTRLSDPEGAMRMNVGPRGVSRPVASPFAATSPLEAAMGQGKGPVLFDGKPALGWTPDGGMLPMPAGAGLQPGAPGAPGAAPASETRPVAASTGIALIDEAAKRQAQEDAMTEGRKQSKRNTRREQEVGRAIEALKQDIAQTVAYAESLKKGMIDFGSPAQRAARIVQAQDRINKLTQQLGSYYE